MIKNVYIIGGQAKISDIAPSIAQFGIKINPSELIKKVNEHEVCVQFEGKKLIAEFYIGDRKLLFNVKTPITSDLIKQFSKERLIGNKHIKTITLDEVRKIAEVKLPDLGTNKLENGIKVILGTVKSCKIMVIDNE
jgi:large subunit ribosomal protein L11